MIRSNSNLLRTGNFSVCGVPPIDVEIPGEDSVVLEIVLQLCTAGSHHNVRRPAQRQFLAVDVCVVQEIYIVNDHALLGSRFALEHLRALHDAGMFLYNIVASAGGNVIAVWPDRRTRVVGKERSEKFVAIVASEGV